MKATDASDLLTLAVGAALSSGTSGGTAQGSVAIADTSKATSVVMNYNDVSNLNSTGTKAKVTAKANNTSKITTSADSLAATTANVALGAGVAVNKNANDTTVSAKGGSYKVKDMLLESTSEAKILNIGIGVAATTGQGGTMAGNVVVNNVKNNTTVHMAGTTVTADGDVGVLATGKEHIKNYVGGLALTLGQGYVGLGASVAVNTIGGNVSSTVDGGSVINASGGEGLDVSLYGVDNDKNLTTGTEKKTGLIIAADGKHEIDSVVVTAGVAAGATAGVAASGTVTVNSISGSTDALLQNSTVNNAATGDKANVQVLANDNTEIDSHVGSAALGIGVDAGVAAGEASDTNVLSRNTQARILGKSNTERNTVNGNKVAAQAFSRQDITTNVIGVSASGGMYGAAGLAGTISVTKNSAGTLA